MRLAQSFCICTVMGYRVDRGDTAMQRSALAERDLRWPVLGAESDVPVVQVRRGGACYSRRAA